MYIAQLKIALRSIFRNRLYSAVNILGLGLGIAAFVLILEYVSLERQVNRLHSRLPQLHRLLSQDVSGKSWGASEPGWAPKMQERFPEIQDFCRLAAGIAEGIVRVESTNESYREKNIGYAEGNFFEIFSFPMVTGEAAALKQADAVFISQSYSRKFFGSDEPIGKSLMLHNQFGGNRYTVRGVFADMGENSSLQYDILVSLETLKNPAVISGSTWAELNNLSSQYIQTVFVLQTGTDYAALERKMTALRTELRPQKDEIRFRLQPLSETHLAASLNDDLDHTGNVRYVWMLGGIAVLILLIAWFNYINLYTANALKRSNEVGVRKVVGATRTQLVTQFLMESALVNTFALVLGIGLATIFQSGFNALIGKKLSLAALIGSSTWWQGLLLLVGGSLVSGAVVALILSGFTPSDILRGRQTVRGGLLRKGLVVLQFGISTALILFTILVYSQLRFMQNKKLGINISELLVIRGPELGRDSTYGTRRAGFWEDINAQSFISESCTSGCVPGDSYNFSAEGFTSNRSTAGDELKVYNIAMVGERYLPVYGLETLAGRNFTEVECAQRFDVAQQIMVNEKALQQLNLTLDNALTTPVKWDNRVFNIVGVVKDYHHEGVQKPIYPIVFYPHNGSHYITVRLNTKDVQQNLAALEKVYRNRFPGNPFEYFFADENYRKSYVSEQQYGQIFSVASLWAILIACMGLFGLATFTVESRIKEIGVRKVLGASVAGITGLLTGEFLRLVLVAVVVASPIAWYFMRQWLADFAYRIEIGWWMFAVAGIGAVSLAALTVGYQSLKAALANPSKSLRSE
jgi:putative ABC transport system permease protein